MGGDGASAEKMKIDPIETRRLIIRPFQFYDLEDFYRYSQNPDVGPHAGWKPHESKEESRDILEKWLQYDPRKDPLILALYHKEDQKVIGSIGLHLDEQRPQQENCRMLGYVLAKEYWYQGLMTEAAKAVIAFSFEVFGLTLLTVKHFSFNQRSKRVIEKAGFTYEGTSKDVIRLFDGSRQDECLYTMTIQDYLKGKEEKDMKMLKTERLILRPFEIDDVDAVFRYQNNPNAAKYDGWRPCETREDAEKTVENLMKAAEKGDENRAIVLKNTQELIGQIGLCEDDIRHRIPRCKKVNYLIGEEHWGKGYATEALREIQRYAFEDAKLNIITVAYLTGNMASKHVMEKCGFRYDGVIRQAMRRYDGKIFDSFEYSMTRREYLTQKAKSLGLTLMLAEELTKDSFMDYYLETKAAETDEYITPSAADLKGDSYENWLRERISFRTKVRDGFVCGTTYFLADKGGRIYGAADIRHSLNEHLSRVGGHIGYGIRPSERQKSYAAMMLALSLEKARELDLTEVLITCDDDNAASYKTMESCGAVMNDKIENDGKLVRRYTIVL